LSAPKTLPETFPHHSTPACGTTIAWTGCSNAGTPSINLSMVAASSLGSDG